ncbi:hypothetical protein KSS87_023390 [Heliosperma pusillum]|nr:hypothetical protein KSS87_019052 [Heliosperma pusillum]KAH9625782.1 hypothetical protein KSS87_023390 [Heliosperma pusillum]
MALPTIVCLKSLNNKKYLRYRDEEVQTHGLVQFSGDKVMDPLAQFEVVAASIGGGLVHIKSRYTDKFLVSDEPKNLARLMHVQLGHYASLSPLDAPFDSCLYAGRSKEVDRLACDVVTVIDWLSINKLPKNVAFKGDNGKYLGPLIDKGITFLQFEYNDPKDPKVAHEAITSSDGTIVIKSKYTGKFWRLSEDHDWIVADIDEPPGNNARAMFRANVVDIGVVALLNMSKTWYCKRYSAAGVRKDLLRAATQSADKWALLEVKDLDNK